MMSGSSGLALFSEAKFHIGKAVVGIALSPPSSLIVHPGFVPRFRLPSLSPTELALPARV